MRTAKRIIDEIHTEVFESAERERLIEEWVEGQPSWIQPGEVAESDLLVAVDRLLTKLDTPGVVLVCELEDEERGLRDAVTRYRAAKDGREG